MTPQSNILKTSIDVELCRKHTPGCETKVHFNNAGASLMPVQVMEAQKEYIDQEMAQGGYETADARAADINGFYKSMGQLLGCSPLNIAFTSSATNSFARALSSIPFEKGDSILLANEDYISNQLAFLSMEKRLGVILHRARSLQTGGVDIDDMREMMDRHHPRLVSISHVPTNSGLVQPVEEIGKLCRERDILYLVDGCQSAGQMPVDVLKIDCDFFTGTFRKFLRGPRGSGFMFVSDHVLRQDLWPVYLDMRGADWTEKNSFRIRNDARRFEDWELPYSLLLGSAAAVNYALGVGLGNIQERNSFLCDQIREKLKSLNLQTLDKGNLLSSIITALIPGKNATEVLNSLRAMNINTSIASRSSAVIDFDAKRVSWALRISPHYYNTTEEIELLAGGIRKIL